MVDKHCTEMPVRSSFLPATAKQPVSELVVASAAVVGPGAGAGLAGSRWPHRGRPDPGGEPAAGGCSRSRTGGGDAQRVSCGCGGHASHPEGRNR